MFLADEPSQCPFPCGPTLANGAQGKEHERQSVLPDDIHQSIGCHPRMRKSRTHFEVPDPALEQQAGGPALVTEASAALGEASPAVHGQAVSRDFLEAALSLDGAGAPHQPVVPGLEGLRLSADRQCEGLAGGGRAAAVQHHEVGRERKRLLLPAVDQDGGGSGHSRMLGISLCSP